MENTYRTASKPRLGPCTRQRNGLRRVCDSSEKLNKYLQDRKTHDEFPFPTCWTRPQMLYVASPETHNGSQKSARSSFPFGIETRVSIFTKRHSPSSSRSISDRFRATTKYGGTSESCVVLRVMSIMPQLSHLWPDISSSSKLLVITVSRLIDCSSESCVDGMFTDKERISWNFSVLCSHPEHWI